MNEDKNIKNLIIDLLKQGSRNIVELIADIQKQRPNTTKQAVYSAIRKLKAEEVAVTHKKYISLNKLWVQKQLDFFTAANNEYNHAGIVQNDILSFEDGDRVSYSFHSPALTDQYWGHIFGVLSENASVSTPVIIYNPHEWFLIAREESERQIFDRLNMEKKLLLLTIGSDSPLDRSVLKEAFKSWNHQFNLKSQTNFKENYYLNIFGDFLIEVYLDSNVTEQINGFYQKYDALTPENINELKAIVAKKGKNKLHITRNKKKAAKLRKQLSKDFYVPAQYKI